MPLLPVTLFKCLSDETRLRTMLLMSAHDELCVCELMCALTDSQPKISRHLAQLRECGLLADRRQGQWVYYRLHPQLPQWARDVLSVTLDANEAWIQADTLRLEQMGDRPLRLTTCC
ncbi:metalloregulator ArsR/SmtB family transcription factor [Pseudomonas huanghezhanensis]|uniref:metalloregulator ArsR/SmtB family transcription factor n=1 Tax=Pseudomonas huanghezhanensis TaxID=3002903 RepID=UPI002285664D|nr:metalloregulator ArsR/SmtB family transcription factor [Pseudomonas sp. BSw22131]